MNRKKILILSFRGKLPQLIFCPLCRSGRWLACLHRVSFDIVCTLQYYSSLWSFVIFRLIACHVFDIIISIFHFQNCFLLLFLLKLCSLLIKSIINNFDFLDDILDFFSHLYWVRLSVFMSNDYLFLLLFFVKFRSLFLEKFCNLTFDFLIVLSDFFGFFLNNLKFTFDFSYLRSSCLSNRVLFDSISFECSIFFCRIPLIISSFICNYSFFFFWYSIFLNLSSLLLWLIFLISIELIFILVWTFVFLHKFFFIWSFSIYSFSIWAFMFAFVFVMVSFLCISTWVLRVEVQLLISACRGILIFGCFGVTVYVLVGVAVDIWSFFRCVTLC